MCQVFFHIATPKHRLQKNNNNNNNKNNNNKKIKCIYYLRNWVLDFQITRISMFPSLQKVKMVQQKWFKFTLNFGQLVQATHMSSVRGIDISLISGHAYTSGLVCSKFCSRAFWLPRFGDVGVGVPPFVGRNLVHIKIRFLDSGYASRDNFMGTSGS